jgi:hypothetical protein
VEIFSPHRSVNGALVHSSHLGVMNSHYHVYIYFHKTENFVNVITFIIIITVNIVTMFPIGTIFNNLPMVIRLQHLTVALMSLLPL